MTVWKNASQGDKRLLHAISILLKNYPYLLDFVFDPHEPELSQSSDRLRREAGALSSGESLLVRLAMDLWNESGDVKFTELDRLDSSNFENVMTAVRYLKGGV